MARQCVHVFVSGRVQGVFFRQAMKTKATQNSVTGWVRNLKDGRVEAVMSGEDEKLGLMIEWCHSGPANAVVDDVIISTEDTAEKFDSFDVRY